MFVVDIHPAAKISSGLMIDHGTGVVIGETCVIGKNCSILHGTTLGGTGRELGDRHPKIGNNVFLGCQAIVLGNIKIGDYSKVGAGSLVLKSTPRGLIKFMIALLFCKLIEF
jgi:serine O-acetyltransferase